MENLFQMEPLEARVFGVLVEKSMTTPDQYPLTLNGTVNGCNQKSNRDPVLSLDEDDVRRAIDGLVRKHLARSVFLENSRVEKYSHRGGEMLGVGAGELAVLAELLMRGPQTPGELRARAARMSDIPTLDQLGVILSTLIERGYARRLGPAPGSRAERYVQLLSPDLHPIDVLPPAYAGRTPDEEEEARAPGLGARVEALEAEVERLRRQIALLAERLGHSLEE